MNDFLHQKKAVVTGGARGIGRAIAARLAREGAVVAICARTAESVASVVVELSQETGGHVIGKAADVSDDRQVADFFRYVDSQLGGLDILVNNAGVGIFAPVAELTIEDWRRTIETNLSGAFYCSREALHRFRDQNGGWIINISSLAGKNPFASGAAYNASKFGLNGFSEAMMMDHRYDNVRVSNILPGSVETEFRPGTSDRQGGWKIAPDDIAEIVLSILRMPERTLISRVEVRPSKPRK